MTSMKERQCLLGSQAQSSPNLYSPDYLETLNSLGLNTSNFQNEKSVSSGTSANVELSDSSLENYSSKNSASFLLKTPQEQLDHAAPTNFLSNNYVTPDVGKSAVGATNFLATDSDRNRILPDVENSLLGRDFKEYRGRSESSSNKTVTSVEGARESIISTPIGSIKLTPDILSMDGQEMVTDEQIRGMFRSEADEQAFYGQLVREYERVLLAEDVEGLAKFEREWFHVSGRFVGHFDRNGDGQGKLKNLRKEIDRYVARAGDSKVMRIRSAYSVYNYHLSGKKTLKEMVADHYLSEFMGLKTGAGGRKQLRGGSKKQKLLEGKAPSDIKIYRSTDTPAGVNRLAPGSIRVFTGQSKKTMRSMLENGLKVTDTNHPGRAHYGRGVYTSQQRAIAERYKMGHREGVVAQATPNVTNLKVINVTAGQGKKAFENYLDSIPGLRAGWRRSQEHRSTIFEGFIDSYVPDVDIVIAPHGIGNQIVFRSPKALAALELSVVK